MRFSANLGFLWTEMPLDRAIYAAAVAGFDAVECHWPYDTAPARIAAALAETGLPMLALNTAAGDRAAGEFGLAALPDRVPAARAAIRGAIDYARAIDADAIHVMSGKAAGPAAHDCFADNLRFALEEIANEDRIILIEPINRIDVPGYFLGDVATVLALMAEIGNPKLRVMADCYHLAQMGHDVVATLRALGPHLGHVQFAGHPGRGGPDRGTLDYDPIFAALDAMGWQRPLGAEYRPEGATEDSLGWLQRQRQRRPAAR